MMHIGKDYSWLGLVTGEVIIGFFNWVLCGGSLLGR
ncbi:Type III secretion inner membrane protein [Salmonella enterica subsp. enterica]|nr:Type III secretion inner membrane protein [Salmonella enterica subsp. enterica]